MKNTITTVFACAIWPIVVMIGPGILGDLNDSSKIGLFDRSYGSPFSGDSTHNNLSGLPFCVTGVVVVTLLHAYRSVLSRKAVH
jgi:hypothetical protein